MTVFSCSNHARNPTLAVYLMDRPLLVLKSRKNVLYQYYLSVDSKKVSSVSFHNCIKGESNPRRVDGNDPGYHYPINAF